MLGPGCHKPLNLTHNLTHYLIHSGTGISNVPSSYIEKQRYDGWYNNLAHPDWGSTESMLTRKTPASYADGVYMMAGQDRPSPRVLSQAFMKGSDGLPSTRNRTAMLAFFGQVVSSEILQASEPGCPIELHKIPIEQCDEMFDKECKGGRFIPFKRAGYDRSTGQSPNNPREQLNYVTSWIDGSFVYSTSEARLNMLRSFKNGTFLTDENDPQMPPRNTRRIPMENNPSPHVLKILPPERMLLMGDERTNQNPAHLAFGILFFRWHNTLAQRIQAQHPDWGDEDVFQRARRHVIAHLQNIILYEFLPAFLGEQVEPYRGYRPEVYAGISHVFQSAAFRFGHTLLPPGLYRRDPGPGCPFVKSQTGHLAMRLCSTWWDANKDCGFEPGREHEMFLVASSCRDLANIVVQRPQTTREELKDDLKASGIEARKHMISRALRLEGLRSRIPHRTPLLKKRHVKARLKYANDHLNKPAGFGTQYSGQMKPKSNCLGETGQIMFRGNKTKSINQSAPYPLLSLEVAQSWCGEVYQGMVEDEEDKRFRMAKSIPGHESD
ncbi:hypothetical protein FHG87_006188 [Trinorchestia longiramus]|nr:hypothetical protein FHG87_006188 [Trinorchestia longiramus]